MSRLRLLDLPADRMEGEAVAALFFMDDRPVRGPVALLDWRLNGFLSALLREGSISGEAGEQVITPTNGKLGAHWVMFAGGGRWHDLDRVRYRELVRELLKSCWQAGFSRIALTLTPLEGMAAEDLQRLVGEALSEAEVGTMECLLSLSGRERARELPRAT
ncbi:MAG: hypothetical protein IH614_00840 [Desulfuromonadales bacterium]|nr:hypothetical protein [Desulfuromonadales bacterium]